MFNKLFYFIQPMCLLLVGCDNTTYEGTCTVSGVIRNHKKGKIELFEITQSKNYLIKEISIKEDGSFETEFEAEEKSLYGISNGSSFIYFINDVPKLSVETSEDEYENYFTEGSPESEQLRQLIITDRKLATELALAEKLLAVKMTAGDVKFGYNPEILDLENKADKRALELRTYMVNYIDTAHDPLLAVCASNFLSMKEEYNYFEWFYKEKLENSSLSTLQKQDIKIEIDKIAKSFSSIAPVKVLGGLDTNKHQIKMDSLGGKYVFVNVWATWCYLSRLEVPHIKNVHEKFKDNPNIEFINVAIDDNFEMWKKYIADEKYNLKNNFCDTLGQKAYVLKRFGLDYIPSNFLLDREGRIITSNLKGESILRTIKNELKTKQ